MRLTLACIAAVACLLVLSALPSGAQGPTPGHGIALPSAPATYADDFSDPQSGWAVWSSAESSGAYESGAFVLTVAAANWAAWSVNPTLPPLDDFTAEVDATLEQGAPQNSLGLAVRLTDDRNLYTFEISGQGRFRITRLQDGQTTVLAPWTASPAILPAPAPNRLAVTCAGSRLAFAVNGREVRRVTDATFAAGAVGLYAARLDRSAGDLRAAFANLVVTPGDATELLPENAAAAVPLVAPTPTRGRLVAATPAIQNTPAAPTPRIQVVIPTSTPAAPTATPKPPRPKPAGGFAGAWQTNFGLMTLTVNGLSVDGPYDYKHGNVMAALSPDGRTITGTWDQDPSHNPPNDAGRLVFHLAADGQSWTGTWGYGTDESAYDNGGAWTGTRVGSAPAPPPVVAAPAPARAGFCQAKPVPGKWVVYFTLAHGTPYMCIVDKEGHPPIVPNPNNPLTLTGLYPSVGDHIRLQTDGPDKQRFFNLMWDCGTNPGAFSPCDFWSSSLWDLQEEIVVNQANQIGTLNLSHYDNWAGVRSGFEPRRYPGDPDFRLMVKSQ